MEVGSEEEDITGGSEEEEGDGGAAPKDKGKGGKRREAQALSDDDEEEQAGDDRTRWQDEEVSANISEDLLKASGKWGYRLPGAPRDALKGLLRWCSKTLPGLIKPVYPPPLGLIFVDQSDELAEHIMGELMQRFDDRSWEDEWRYILLLKRCAPLVCSADTPRCDAPISPAVADAPRTGPTSCSDCAFPMRNHVLVP
jgi:hypothetical protein